MPAGERPLASPGTPSFDILERAARWFALLRSGDATDQDRARWQHWLEQCAEHRQAWQYVQTVSDRFAPIQHPEHRQAAVKAMETVRSRHFTRRRLLSGGIVIVSGGLLGAYAWRRTALRGSVLAWSADYRTNIGEIREVGLADGTRTWLNTATALNVHYAPSQRRVELLAGEVLIETAHESARPFVLDTVLGRVRALGTRFSVRLLDGSLGVSVFEGAVEIAPTHGTTTSVIHAGQQLSLNRAGLGTTTSADRARQAWTNGVLLADNMRLDALVQELSRYRRGHLGVAPEVAGLRVLGGYPLQDSDRALALLESALPIRVHRRFEWWVTIEARPPAS